MYLTIDEILNANDIREKDVEIPEWPDKDGKPGRVRVRSITKGAQSQFLSLIRNEDGSANSGKAEIAMLIASIVSPKLDEKGFEILRSKSAKAVDRIVKAITELNGDVSAAGEVPSETAFLPGTKQGADDAGNIGGNRPVSGNGAAPQNAA